MTKLADKAPILLMYMKILINKLQTGTAEVMKSREALNFQEIFKHFEIKRKQQPELLYNFHLAKRRANSLSFEESLLRSFILKGFCVSLN